jgi:Glycosyl hydrolases family 43
VDITPKFSAQSFREGVFVIKRKGIYYFLWSVDDARSPNYRVAYGMAQSPFGPITMPAHNVILSKHGLAIGTGHCGVVNVPAPTVGTWPITVMPFQTAAVTSAKSASPGCSSLTMARLSPLIRSFPHFRPARPANRSRTATARRAIRWRPPQIQPLLTDLFL